MALNFEVNGVVPRWSAASAFCGLADQQSGEVKIAAKFVSALLFAVGGHGQISAISFMMHRLEDDRQAAR